MVGFIFGGNTGVTQADLNRQREIAKRLAASRSGAPRNVGEGLTFLGEALAYRIAQGRANRMEDDLQARFEEDMGALFPPISGIGGSSGDYTAPASAPPSVPDTMRVSGVDPELGFGEVQSPEDVPAPDMTGTPLLGFGATSPTLAGVGGEDPTMKGTPTLAPDAVAPLLVEALRKRKAGPQPGEMPSMWEPGQPRLGDAQLGFDNALNTRMSTRGVPAGGDNAFRAALVQRESSGDPNRVNSEGFTGLYQFGQQRLDDFNRATGANVTTQDLIGNPELQEKVADWHFTDIDKAIDGLGTDMSRNGLRAVAHLGGVEGMRRFVASGGQYNPSDSNGTRLADYYREFSALEDGGSPETVVGRDGPNWDQWATGGAAGRDDSFTGLQPEMQRRVAAFMQAADAELGAGALKITSAYRSPELQARLYQQSGGSGMVAPPGRSQHNFGAAIDLVGANGELLRDPNSPEAVWVRENAPRFGLSTPIAFHSDGRPFEPWQVELAGHRSGKVEPWQSPEVAPSGPIAWNTPQERDTAFLSRISAGDVPDFVNSTFPVEIASGLPEGVQRIVFDVGATPIAVNGENGPMLLPASAKLGAQAAAALGGALPTRRIVEEMYRQQPTRPMPTQTPGPGMTGADAVMQSSAAMFADGATGPIVGTTKEILADGSFMGGDNGRGGMWQPYIGLNVDHNADYADYSHGARVVRGATVYPTNGEPYQVSAAELYSDPQYAEALGLSGPVQAPQPTRVADAGPAMRMSAKDMPQGGGRASDLIPYAMSDGRGAILPEREVFRPTIDKGGATNPQITAPSAPAPGFYEDPTPGRYDPDLVMRLYNAQQQWGNRMSAGQKALVDRIIANEAKQQGGWDYDPNAAMAGYELKDVNGDGVMEYVNPTDPRAPIIPMQGVEGPQSERETQFVDGIGLIDTQTGETIRPFDDYAGAGEDGGGDMTESERRLFLFANIQKQTSPVVDLIEERGFDPSSFSQRFPDGIGGNFLKTPEGRWYEAAATAWAEGALRLSTGAAANAEEVPRIRNTYFAQAGDDLETIQFKRAMRAAYAEVIKATLAGDPNAELPNPLLFATEEIYRRRDEAKLDPERKDPPLDGGDGAEASDPDLDEDLRIAEEAARRLQGGNSEIAEPPSAFINNRAANRRARKKGMTVEEYWLSLDPETQADWLD